MHPRLIKLYVAASISLGTSSIVTAEPPQLAPERKLPPIIQAQSDIEPIPMPTTSNWTSANAIDHQAQCDCEECQPHFLRGNCRHGRGGLLAGTRIGTHWHAVTKPRLQESHWGYCDQFCERPFGMAVAGHFQNQIANGLGQQMMLFDYDFQEIGGQPATQLNSRGIYQLAKIAQRFQQGLRPILVASADQEGALDQGRRVVIENELRRMGITASGDDIVVQRATLVGPTGYEFLSIQKNREQLTTQRGVGGLSTGSGMTSGIGGNGGTGVGQSGR